MSLAARIEAARGAALLAEGKTWEYADLLVAARRVADHVRDPLSPERPIVALASDLVPEAVIALHGVVRAGAVLSPIPPAWRPDEWDRYVDFVSPDAALVTSAGTPPPAGWGSRRIALSDGTALALWHPTRDRDAVGSRQGPPDADGPTRRRAVLPAGTDVLLWTSGTVGRPKVVCHAWDALLANAEAANRRLGAAAHDRWLASLAWSHVGGLAVPLRALVAGGAVAFGPPRFEPRALLAALARRRATQVSLVPAMLHALLDANAGRPAPPSLRAALLGGAATPPSLVTRSLEGGWPIALTYGLTEAGSQVATAPPDETRARPDLVGRPLEGTEVRIAPEGEILVRGPTLMRGYLGEAETAEAGGWLATDDLGTLDEEGRLRVFGRRADRIVTGGANVDPAEIEALLASHPEVAEACVIGTPDDVWGEIVTAIVVPRGRAAPDLVARLEAWTRERVSGARRPRRWELSAGLPHTSAGKVDRRSVRRALITPSGEAGA